MIPAIILAAGKSTRMGRSKALLPLGRTRPDSHDRPDDAGNPDNPGMIDGPDTFLTRIVRTLHEAGVDEIFVVLGHNADAIADRLRWSGLPAHIVLNPDYESGQLSSFLAGLRAAARQDVEAMLVTLVDIPLVSATTVRAVVDRYRSRRALVVRPVRGADHGHPVLVDRALFSLIEQANPAEGVKPIIRAHVSQDGDVEVDDADSFLDVDTPEEYAQLLARLGADAAGGGGGR